MAELGFFAVLLGLAAAGWAVLAAGLGIRRADQRVVRSAEAGLHGAFLSLTVSAAVLWALLTTRDFSVRYVAEYVDQHLSIPLTIAAFWAGQSGSLLFWAWMLAGAATLTTIVYRHRHRALMPVVVLILALVLVAFTALVAFTSNPFERLGFTPSDGAGLNPMLQNWGMLYHPPATFLGYIGFTVPFAFAVAALVTGRLDAEWVRAMRPWMLTSWVLLGVGIVLGARWAYTELGWGGYWAWDPVENVSLLPWLTATAYLHTAVLQERRGKLRVLNLALLFATFALTVFATFVVRSGVASSVHAFAESTAGLYLLALIGAVVVAGVMLIIWRFPQLQDASAQIGGLSRETLIVLTNAVLALYSLAIFWGTLYPVVVGVVGGQQVTVGAPFFNAVTIPVALVLLVLFGLAPLVAWRRARDHALQHRLLLPVGAAMLAGGAAAWLDGGRRPLTVLTLALSAFALTTILLELQRGIRHRRPRGTREGRSGAPVLFRRDPRRYGGAVAHLGIVLLIVGVTLDVTYRSDERHTLTVGESVEVGRYVLTFRDLASEITRTRMSVVATFGVARQGGRDLGSLTTERSLDVNQEDPRTAVGIRSLVREDVYVILQEIDVDTETASVIIHLHPGVLWLWLGSGLLVLGGLLALLPRRRQEPGEERGHPEEPPVLATAGTVVAEEVGR
jgi:cytochrome c-type biogenesis protein CcmF